MRAEATTDERPWTTPETDSPTELTDTERAALDLGRPAVLPVLELRGCGGRRAGRRGRRNRDAAGSRAGAISAMACPREDVRIRARAERLPYGFTVESR